MNLGRVVRSRSMATMHYVCLLLGFGLEDLKYVDVHPGLFQWLAVRHSCIAPAQYLTPSSRHIGFGTLTTNLLTIPSTIGSMISIVLITHFPEAIDQRMFIPMSETVWLLLFIIAPCAPLTSLILGFTMRATSRHQWPCMLVLTKCDIQTLSSPLPMHP